MHDRTERRVIPNTDLYVVCHLADREDHWFKTPSMLVGMRLFKQLDSAKLVALAGIQGTLTANPASLFAVLSESGPELLQALGFLIGNSWHHPTVDLDTVESDYPGPMEYGEAVFEELHDGGYDLNQVVAMALCVASNWINRNKVSTEAAEKAGFFQPQKVSGS